MVRHTYLSCMRPMLSYAAFAFSSKFTKNHIKKPSSIQRTALMMTGNNRKDTPLAGLEVILNIPPINIFLRGESIKPGHRIRNTSEEVKATNGHVNRLRKDAEEIGIPNKESDSNG